MELNGEQKYQNLHERVTSMSNDIDFIMNQYDYAKNVSINKEYIKS